MQVIEDILYYRTNGDDESLRKMLEELKDEPVSLAYVGYTLVEAMDDLIELVNSSQALQEMRLLHVIRSLPDDIQTKIKEGFKEVEDDLLEEGL